MRKPLTCLGLSRDRRGADVDAKPGDDGVEAIHGGIDASGEHHNGGCQAAGRQPVLLRQGGERAHREGVGADARQEGGAVRGAGRVHAHLLHAAPAGVRGQGGRAPEGRRGRAGVCVRERRVRDARVGRAAERRGGRAAAVGRAGLVHESAGRYCGPERQARGAGRALAPLLHAGGGRRGDDTQHGGGRRLHHQQRRRDLEAVAQAKSRPQRGMQRRPQCSVMRLCISVADNPSFHLSGGHRVTCITNGHFIHAGLLTETGVSIIM